MFNSVDTIIYTVPNIDEPIPKRILDILQRIDDILALRNPGKSLS